MFIPGNEVTESLIATSVWKSDNIMLYNAVKRHKAGHYLQLRFSSISSLHSVVCLHTWLTSQILHAFCLRTAWQQIAARRHSTIQCPCNVQQYGIAINGTLHWDTALQAGRSQVRFPMA